jgi:predicted ATPase
MCFAGCLFHAMRRDGDSLKMYAEELMRLSQERSLAGWLASGTRFRGEALAVQGKIQEGMAQAKEGRTRIYTENMYTGTLASLAEVLSEAGRLKEGLTTLDEAFAIVDRTDERYWEEELHRLKGELLLKQGEDVKAEISMHKAIEIARKQSAKSLELRAAMSQSRLWDKQGRKMEAHRLLTEIYDWFTEGFDTPDLVEAQRLLAKLQK